MFWPVSVIIPFISPSANVTLALDYSPYLKKKKKKRQIRRMLFNYNICGSIKSNTKKFFPLCDSNINTIIMLLSIIGKVLLLAM